MGLVVSEIQLSQRVLSKQLNPVSFLKHPQQSVLNQNSIKRPHIHAFLHYHILFIPSLRENTGNKECELPQHNGVITLT